MCNIFFRAAILNIVSTLVLCIITLPNISAQRIPSRQVLKTENLSSYLKEGVKKDLATNGAISQKSLAHYLREKFSERYFYDWKTFDKRFNQYNQIYQSQDRHNNRAKDHMQKYAALTFWKLPFNYLNGEEVNAYALRHLARQHKMVDIAYQYHYSNGDTKYIQYFVQQMQSLNEALASDAYETIEDGNGVYEAFRSGYRVLNWLVIHQMFLGEAAYTDQDQLTTIATLLQHGAHLYENNAKFHSGNHQTRGVSALAMLSILLRDFEGTDQWYQRAMQRLGEHLEKEINQDGFQFERSVHYHMSDIGNFFYVYQLAKISGLEVEKAWENKLKLLFTTLAKIAYPDRSTPVLQDDTEIPWGEKNDISGTMTLGYLLFEDPELGYFAGDRVNGWMYWFLQEKQLDLLTSVQKKKPEYGSLHFPNTHYYVMREGWKSKDKMMIISAGLDSLKPDHQHGDMLGVQAMVNGHTVLPKYQVRYNLPDFQLFKNSMVKNVALVDDELQGKHWTSNKGGSGFGKFRKLPDPVTLTWKTQKNFDLFVGSHNGFENVGVNYTRQVLYVKDDFWIVKDNFIGQVPHTYKQVWQGHYTHEEGAGLIRSVFDDATGLDIYQLNDVDHVVSSGARGKQWSIVSKSGAKNYQFITVLFPYIGYDNRIKEEKNPSLKGWKINDLAFLAEGKEVQSISKQNESFLFGVKKLSINGLQVNFLTESDVFISMQNKLVSLQSISDKDVNLTVSGSQSIKLERTLVNGKIILKPGAVLECKVSKLR
jgi:hypothetical protein